AEPDVAVITNVAPVHLEFFPSVDAIADAKAEILEGLRTGGTAVLNGDDVRVRQIGARRGGDIIWFGHDRAFGVTVQNDRPAAHGMRFDLIVGDRTIDITLPLAGPHYLMNFLAAVSVSVRLGIDLRLIADAALNLKPAPHR